MAEPAEAERHREALRRLPREGGVSEGSAWTAEVAAARAGDRDAFGVLHARFAPVVHAILLAQVPIADASDLTQDVFLIAWTRLASLEEDAAFAGWICRIARSRAADYHRGQRRPLMLPAEQHQPAPVSAEVAEVLEVIRTLPEAYRETLLLRLVEDLTGPEIADRTGLSPGSVRVNLHRGMKLLREKLGVAGE
jgi:RNA polymerase sigma-70 factor (ECF subfamily)